jgi:hypothetical protein
MPAHVTSTRFVITSWRSGAVVDSQMADDGAHALQLALMMLSELGPTLKHGDRIDIIEGAVHDLPEPSRSR